MKEKERRQFLGEAVCAFANAQTTEEACFEILTGIQKISDFSSSFIEEIRKDFPTKSNITPPPKKFDEEYNEMISQEDKVLSGLQEKLGPPFELSCDRHKQLIWISLSSSKLEGFRKLPEWKQAVIQRAAMGMGNTRVRMDDSSPLKNYKIRLYSPLEHSDEFDLQDYEDMHEAIVAMTSGHESVFDNIKNLELDLQKSWIRFNTIMMHEEIAIQQRILGKILDSLIFKKLFGQEVKRKLKVDGRTVKVAMSKWLEMLQKHRDFALEIYINSGEFRHKPIREDVRLSYYLQVYDEMSKYVIKIDMEDNLKKFYPISEEDYLSINLPRKWLERIRTDLAYCLIEFLLNEDKRKLSKCTACLQFFIADDIRRTVCYSPKECKKIRKRRYQKDYMADKRDPDSPTFDPDYVS